MFFTEIAKQLRCETGRVQIGYGTECLPMPRRRLRWAVYAAAAALAVGGGVSAAMAATAPSNTSGVTATFSKDSDWGSGYQARFTIANRGPGAVDKWEVKFSLPAGSSVGTHWDATVTSTGTQVKAVNKNYNASIKAG